ncbi:MAG TPA: TCR/Tet family MFS transporter [Lacunisphaera sp.]|nr:TCR/Tet family MFS transporter [Lacunisphaera sp.]
MESHSPRQPGIGFIFVTVMLAVVGFGLLIPVLPKLVVQLEGEGIASGSSTYGWIITIYAMMQFVGSPILGSLSDRFGRRRIILIATAGSMCDYGIMAWAPTLTWFFVARTIAGFTAGVLSTANAYIADTTPPEKRAHAYGILGAAFGVGFILGPVAGGLLGNIGIRLPFWFAAGCAAANWLYGFFVLPESLKPENRRSFDWKRANPFGALLALRRFPAVLSLVESFFLIMLSQAMLYSIWALYMDYRYHWNPRDVGLSLALAGVTTGLVQGGLVKRIVPRLGVTRTVVVGLCVSIGSMICYGLATKGWMIYAVICFGAFAGITGPALQTYITKHVPANEQGGVQGVLTGLQSLAGIPGPWIGTHSFGWAIDPAKSFHVPGIAFFEGAGLVCIALGLAVRSFRKFGDGDAAAGPADPAAPVAPAGG